MTEMAIKSILHNNRDLKRRDKGELLMAIIYIRSNCLLNFPRWDVTLSEDPLV